MVYNFVKSKGRFLLVHPYHLDESIPRFRDFWQMFSVLLHFSIEISVSCVDPDRTKLGLYCLYDTPKTVIGSKAW